MGRHLVGDGKRHDRFVRDMGDHAAESDLSDRVEAKHGPVSTLVNNAGIALPGSFLGHDLADLRSVIDVNLIGAFVATQRAARKMIDKGIEGAIVNMSSINAQVAIPAIPAHCASKGGLMQLTKAAALALSPQKIVSMPLAPVQSTRR